MKTSRQFYERNNESNIKELQLYFVKKYIRVSALSIVHMNASI